MPPATLVAFEAAGAGATSWGFSGSGSGGAGKRVHWRVAGLASVLPLPSVARTLSVWSPTAMPLNVAGEPQAPQAPASSLHWKVEPASVAVNSSVAVGRSLLAAGPAVIVVSGGVVSPTGVAVGVAVGVGVGVAVGCGVGSPPPETGPPGAGPPGTPPGPPNVPGTTVSATARQLFFSLDSLTFERASAHAITE